MDASRDTTDRFLPRFDAAGLVTAQPRKRPKTSYVRFDQNGIGWAIASHANIAPLTTTVTQNTA